MTEQLQELSLSGEWEKVCGTLEKEVGNRMVLKWLKRSIPARKEMNRVCLSFPSPCIEEMIKRNYSQQILEVWQRENPLLTTLDFEVQQAPAQQKELKESAQKTVAKKQIAASAIKRHGSSKIEIEVNADSESIPCFLDENHTFERFVVGPSNVFAFEAAKRVAEDAKDVFNPLYIHSSVGLGKTHLMHAIAWRAKELFPNKNVLYISSEQFVQRFLKVVRSNSSHSFQSLFSGVDILMVDDIQFICEKEKSQEAFFHLFNHLIACGKKIILSADSHPLDLVGMSERLKTRVAQGLVVQIEPTTYELRLSILKEKLKYLSIQVSEPVIDLLAKNITSSVREMEGALKRLAAHAEIMGTEINPQTTRMVLKDMFHAYQRQFSIQEIQRATAEFYGLSLADLQSARRDRKIARPRQLAMYLAKTATALSLPDIGKHFSRDHTTVLHAVKTIEGLLEKDKQLGKDKEYILTHLREDNK